jgi:uncharacterized repeat protein (TIGR01451 family)
MIGMNRRKCVMGNGRWSGSSLGESSGDGSGKSSGKSSGRSNVGWVRLGAVAAMAALLVVGTGLLGLSSRRHSQKAQVPASPIPLSTAFASRAAAQVKPDAKAVLGGLPLVFEPNQGQANPEVRFLASGAGYSLLLNESGAVLALQTAPKSGRPVGEQFVRMKLAGADPAAVISGTGPLPGKSNYFIGNDPRQWHSGVPQFAGVRYERVYPGIDLVFYGNQGQLEYDFRVAPGSDPSRAELEFDGASQLELKDGDLVVTAEKKDNAVVRLRAPQVYQYRGDRRNEITGRFVLRADNRVGFEIGAYDHSRELVIDPVLQFSTYFGGSGTETSPSVAVNGDGFIYLAGSTASPIASFPLNGTVPTTVGSNPNIFVAKISPSQPPAVVYITFLGGNGSDSEVGLAVDGGGNAYFSGNTTSTNFPTTSLAYQTAPLAKGTQCSAACTSVFVSVLNSLGSALTYSSYLSGNGNDVASGMTIDTNQDLFVTGTTTSNNPASNDVVFPATLLPVPFQSTSLSSIQFFVTKVNTTIPGVSSIAYSTYFGGSTPANPVVTGGGITVDTTGNIYFSGTTNFFNTGSGNNGSGGSGDFPILNPYQPCLDTLPPPSGPAIDNKCFAPTTTPFPTDGFMAKLNPLGQTGSQLLFSTYFGGTSSDSSTAITIDSGAANIYLTGSTNSSDIVLPTGTLAFQECLNTPPPNTLPCPTPTTAFDAYVARFSNPAPSTTGTTNFVLLTYFSYLGGSGNETGTAVAVDTASDALLTGFTNSKNFPVTTGAIQSALNGAQNAFFAHIDTAITTNNNQVGSSSTYFGGNGTDRGTSIAIDPNLNAYFAGDTTSSTLEVFDPLSGPGGTTQNNVSRDAFVVKLGSAASLCISCTAPVISSNGTTSTPTVSAGNPVTITYTVSNDGPDVATGIIVTGLVPTVVTFNSASAGSGTCSSQSGTTIACQIPTLQAGSTSSVVFNVTPVNPGTFEATATISSANDTNTTNSGQSVANASFTATGFSVSIAPSGQTVAAGQSAQFTVVVAPTQGVFAANVSLSCGGTIPTGAACNFTTSTITLNGGAGSASTILNLSTTAQPTPTAAAPWRGPLYALWLMVPGMAFLGLGAEGKRQRTWLRRFALMLFVALMLLLPACHSAKTQPTVAGTPSGTFPLTVTASSGSLTLNAPFSLSVTP